MTFRLRPFLSLTLLAWLALTAVDARAQSDRLKVLFLGDDGHHNPAERAADLLAPLARAGIDLAYTDDLADLNADNLKRYDCLLIYANHTKITPEQERALLEYVNNGGGLVDDNRKPIGQAALEAIGQQLEGIHRTMAARGIPAGGPLALRLFS